jgi:prefoldin subunit 5
MSVPRQAEHLQKQRDAIRAAQLEVRKIKSQLQAMELTATLMTTISVLVCVLTGFSGAEFAIGVAAISAMMVHVGDDLAREAIERERNRIYSHRRNRRISCEKLRAKRARVAWNDGAKERAEAAKLERRRQKVCGTKVGHERQDQAAGHRRQLIRKGSTRLNVYSCEFCGKWHVGHDWRDKETPNGLTHRPFEKLLQEKSA